MERSWYSILSWDTRVLEHKVQGLTGLQMRDTAPPWSVWKKDYIDILNVPESVEDQYFAQQRPFIYLGSSTGGIRKGETWDPHICAMHQVWHPLYERTGSIFRKPTESEHLQILIQGSPNALLLEDINSKEYTYSMVYSGWNNIPKFAKAIEKVMQRNTRHAWDTRKLYGEPQPGDFVKIVADEIALEGIGIYVDLTGMVGKVYNIKKYLARTGRSFESSFYDDVIFVLVPTTLSDQGPDSTWPGVWSFPKDDWTTYLVHASRNDYGEKREGV